MRKEVIKRMNIKNLILKSYSEAKAVNIKAKSDGERNRQRSSKWVKTLADNFSNAYGEAIKVFSKGCRKNRGDFKINELLHDITVCSVAKVAAIKPNKKLSYITKVHWQIESEFAKNSREAVIDFNKLVLGSADNKLFIGPIVKDHDKFMETLAAPARMCSGNVYATFLPHPSEWDDTHVRPKVYQFVGDGWSPIS